MLIAVEWSDEARAAIDRLNRRNTVLVERPLAQRPDGSIIDMSLRMSALLSYPVTRVRCLDVEQALDVEYDLKRALINFPGLQVRFGEPPKWTPRPRGGVAQSLRRASDMLWPGRNRDMPGIPAPQTVPSRSAPASRLGR